MKQIGNYNYDENNCLGQGAYGKVYEGINTLNNETVAIKKLDLILFEKDKYLRKQIVQEIEIMSKLNHQNIVKFVELLATKKALFIVTEMCRNGDLKQLISTKSISEQQALNIMKQIIDGFKELVKIGVIHRDMKPANVLNDNGVVKIADFGFAKYVENYSSQLLKSCVGSPLYMAPQVLERNPYSTKCDIWSLGVIFYEMITYDVPWKGRDEEDLLQNIKSQQLNIPENISNLGKQFLQITLIIDEEKRASWKDLFELFENLTLNAGLINEIISEESIQKVPTWIRRPSQIQHQITFEQVKTEIEDLVKQREKLAYKHFVLVEYYSQSNEELQTNSIIQAVQLLSTQIVDDSSKLIKNCTDLFQKVSHQLNKGALWKLQEQLNNEHNYYQQLKDDITKKFTHNFTEIVNQENLIKELNNCSKSQVAELLLQILS